jgi:hypothetical protein
MAGKPRQSIEGGDAIGLMLKAVGLFAFSVLLLLGCLR